MQFLLFLMSFALNPVILMHVPASEVAGFFPVFSTANMVFSLLFTIAFSYGVVVKYIEKGFYCSVLLFCLAWLFIGKPVVWALYPFALLASDYITSQSGKARLALIYRCFLIVSVLPIFFIGSYFYEFIVFRSLACILFALIVVVHSDGLIPLATKSPVKMIAVSYVFYSGSLMLLAFAGTSVPQELKYWYIGTQIGLGLILKKLDFSLRALDSTKVTLLLRVLSCGVLLIPSVLVFIYPNMLFVAIYAISAVALMQLKADKKL